jgi:hypothetical protein
MFRAKLAPAHNADVFVDMKKLMQLTSTERYHLRGRKTVECIATLFSRQKLALVFLQSQAEKTH